MESCILRLCVWARFFSCSFSLMVLFSSCSWPWDSRCCSLNSFNSCFKSLHRSKHYWHFYQLHPPQTETNSNVVLNTLQETLYVVKCLEHHCARHLAFKKDSARVETSRQAINFFLFIWVLQTKRQLLCHLVQGKLFVNYFQTIP